MASEMHYKAAIFDMDGTILNTSGDLTAAVNYAMGKFGHRSDFPIEDGCAFFGSGAHTAIQRALAREAGMDRGEVLKIGSASNSVVPGIDEKEVLKILEVYQPYYKAHNAILTHAYPGITDLLKSFGPPASAPQWYPTSPITRSYSWLRTILAGNLTLPSARPKGSPANPRLT